MARDFVTSTLNALSAGQQQRDRTTQRNALSAYQQSGDESALAPLIGLGDFGTLEAARGYRSGVSADRTRQQAGALAATGDYRGAARMAAGAGHTDLAGEFQGLGRNELQATREIGERGASALFATLQLRGATPQETQQRRFDYIAQNHADIAAALNITPQQLQAMDLTDDQMLRARASEWLDVARLAGEISTQRVGDNIETVRTDETGSTVLDRREMPQTRAEQFERQQFDYRRGQDELDNNYRAGRAAADDEDRQWRRENDRSRSDVEGSVLDKAVREGIEALTPAERAIYDRAVAISGQGGGGLFGLDQSGPAPTAAPAPQGQPQPQPQRQAQPRPQAGGDGSSPSSPARPQDQAAFARLPSGAYFIDPGDGQIYRKD